MVTEWPSFSLLMTVTTPGPGSAPRYRLVTESGAITAEFTGITAVSNGDGTYVATTAIDQSTGRRMSHTQLFDIRHSATLDVARGSAFLFWTEATELALLTDPT